MKQEHRNLGLFNATRQELQVLYERFCDEKNPEDQMKPSHALENWMSAFLQTMYCAERYRYFKKVQ